MNAENTLAIIFLAILGLFVYFNRKKLQIHKIFLFPLLYFAMWKTKLGLVQMDKAAKRFPRLLKYLGYCGIAIGFLGMAVISFELIRNFYKIFTTPEALPGVGIVLPIEAKGVFYVPFFYWIISIFILAAIHEFAHGVIARLYNMKVKSSGFAFVGLIIPIMPAAFVEPDEKEIKKRPYRQQLSVFAAGPLANILLGFVLLAVFALIAGPTVLALYDFNGVEISEFAKEKFPAELAGMQKGEVIKEIDGMEMMYTGNFSMSMESKKPGDVINIRTDRKEYSIRLEKNPGNETKGYMGVYVTQSKELKDGIMQRYGSFVPKAVIWLLGLLYWLYVLNLGIGLFNLVPIGPVDGGRMLQVALFSIFKNDKDKANKIWARTGLFFLALILANVAFAFIR